MPAKKQMQHIYVGVDLHKQHHTAVIIDCWTEKLGEIRFENKPAAYPELIAEVNRHLPKGITPIYGLEDTGGYGRGLAVFLQEQGQIVKEVNAALSCARRKSFAIVEKSDSWDAECVAKVLIENLNALPDAKPDDIYWAVSQLVTLRRGIAKTLIMQEQKLHQQLSYQYPSYKKFFNPISGKTALAFWERFPAPHHLAGISADQLAEFLRTYSNGGISTKRAESILDMIRTDGETRRDYQEQRDMIVTKLIRKIRFHLEELADIEQELGGLLKQMGIQLESVPGISTVTAAEFVAEIGNIHRFATADKLAQFAGIAPIKDGSGNKMRFRKKKLGNRVLHDLFKDLAARQIQVARTSKKQRNPHMYAYYEQKLAAGKTKQQALVCIMRKLVNIIYSMMKNGTEYEMPALPPKAAG